MCTAEANFAVGFHSFENTSFVNIGAHSIRAEKEDPSLYFLLRNADWQARPCDAGVCTLSAEAPNEL
jgi:hypothetical protein